MDNRYKKTRSETINSRIEEIKKAIKIKKAFIALEGWWSMISSYALLCIIAYYFAPWKDIIIDLRLFFSGNAQDTLPGNFKFLEVVPIIAAIIVMELLLSILAGIFGSICVGNGGKNALKSMKPNNILKTLFIVVVAEELFARWFFLGFMANDLNLGNYFYVLLIAGNGIWAWVHLYNYEDPNKRQLIRVLPQFIAGLFFSYVYVKFGLMATILTHFGSNAILFASDKNQIWDKKELRRLLTLVVFGGAILILIWLQVDIIGLFKQFVQFDEKIIRNWTTNDFFALYISMYFVINTVFTFMMYDKNSSREKKEETVFIKKMVKIMVAAVIIIGLVVIVNWGLSFFTNSLIWKSFISTIIVVLLIKHKSPNAAMRTFWTTIPLSMVSFTALIILPFSSCLVFLIVCGLIVETINEIAK